MSLKEAWTLCEGRKFLAMQLRKMADTQRKLSVMYNNNANERWRKTDQMDVLCNTAQLHATRNNAVVDSLIAMAENVYSSAKIDFLQAVMVEHGPDIVIKKDASAWSLPDGTVFKQHATLITAIENAIKEGMAVAEESTWHVEKTTEPVTDVYAGAEAEKKTIDVFVVMRRENGCNDAMYSRHITVEDALKNLAILERKALIHSVCYKINEVLAV